MTDPEYATLEAELAAADRALRSTGARFSFTPEPKPVSKHLEFIESELGASFSPSYRRFLERWDGARFSVDVGYDDATRWSYEVTVLSSSAALAATLYFREFINDLSDSEAYHKISSSIFVFCRYGKSGDVCLFDLSKSDGFGEYPVCDGFNETPLQWLGSPIATSFSSWLQAMLDSVIRKHQGLEYWNPTSISELLGP